MKIYCFEQDTKEYIGVEDALLDPLETKKQGKEIYLIPANAVLEEPPAAEEGKAIIYSNGWKSVPDNRGKEAVNTDRGRFEIDYIGEHEGDTILTDELITAIEKGEKVIRNGAVIDKPVEEKEAEARMFRNVLLSTSDKYMVPDFPATEEEKENYIAYRQYLRDYPASLDFPKTPAMTFEEWSNKSLEN